MTITNNEFSEAFDRCLKNNSTINEILGKSNNAGFTSRLIVEALKRDLIDELFTKPEEAMEKALTEETEDQPEDPEEDATETTEETKTDDAGENLDELDDLE